jgi:hypothetical protein
MTLDYENIKKTLLACRDGASGPSPPDVAGVYALFLNSKSGLANLTVESDVLYVGMTGIEP